MLARTTRFTISIGRLMILIAASTVILGLPVWLGAAGWLALGWIAGSSLMAGLTIVLALATPPRTRRESTTISAQIFVLLAVIFQVGAIAISLGDYLVPVYGWPSNVNSLSRATGCTLSVAAFSFAAASVSFGEEARRRVIGSLTAIVIIGVSALPGVLVVFAWATYVRGY